MTLQPRLSLGLWLALSLLSPGCTSQGVPGHKRAVDIVPSRLDLGILTQNESVRAAVELRNLGAFAVRLGKPNPDGRIPITVRLNNDEIPAEARAASGKLLIQSNDAREPRKEVPLFGFGKVNKLAPLGPSQE